MKYSRSLYGLSTPYIFKGIFTRSVNGRMQGGAKIGKGDFLLQNTSFSDRKATATNRIHSNDLEACGKTCLFLVSFRSQSFDAVLASF